MKIKIEVELDTDKPTDRDLLEELIALIEEYKRDTDYE